MHKSDQFYPLLAYVGQHYDEISSVFFDDLKIKKPDILLGCTGGSHAEYTAKIMVAFEPILLKNSIDLIVVEGDVNATLACSLVASKLHVPIAHIEAGLRSFDHKMPKEINRILTDKISDYLFTTCEDAKQNLLKEGFSSDKIFFVGNLMIDTLYNIWPKTTSAPPIHTKSCCPNKYGLITLHYPLNIDIPNNFHAILKALDTIQKELPLIWPIHPNVRNAMKIQGIEQWIQSMKNLTFLDPLSYIDNLSLMKNAHVVITDSGSIQEETTALGVPCLTVRQNTEHSVTITQGTNQLVGIDTDGILKGFYNISKTPFQPTPPSLWDGQTAPRIVKILKEHCFPIIPHKEPKVLL